MSAVTIVMYHYVRDLAISRFPGIKARTVDEFDRQLDHIAANYNVVTAEQVIAACKYRHMADGLIIDERMGTVPLDGPSELPSRALWLTFDDGFADHYQTVLPRLYDRKWQGSFYAPQAVTVGIVLDVHKIHHILAVASAQEIVAHIQEFIEQNQSGCDMVFDVCRAKYAVANYLDDTDTVFVKMMLQTILPQPFRSQLVASLFELYVTVDERDFAAELYMTTEQMRMMVCLGHHFGNHGVSHEWLKPLPTEQREREIKGGMEFLASIGQVMHWGMCYPSNEYDADLMRMVGNLGGVYGLTANVGIADLSQHSMLELPRLDTNDLPH